MNFSICSKVRSVIMVDKPVYYYFTGRADNTLSSHQTTLSYEKDFNNALYSIFEQNNIANKYQSELTKFSLGSIRGLVRRNIIFSPDDEWICSVKSNCVGVKLTFKEYAITLALRYRVVQQMLYLIHFLLHIMPFRIYRYLKMNVQFVL